MKPQTIRRWRFDGKGPRVTRLGCRLVRYRLADIEAFEAASNQGR